MLKFRFGLGLCSVAAISLAAFLLNGPLQAQDARPLLERIDRLERDLNQLQRQVYRNQVGTAPTPTVGEGGASSLDSQIRMDQLEGQLRTLTGQLEEIQYNIAQISKRAEKSQADNEVRFQQLERGNVAPPSVEATQAHPPAKPNAGAGDMGRQASVSGTLAPPGGPPPPAGASGTLADGSVTEQYNYAFGLLRDSDFKAAEAAFRSFLQKHPADPLAGNAQYWLGETYFVRGEYPAAASAFAEGYQKYPQGAKAPDNLLKLGMALGNSGRKNDACFSFARLERDFPQMPPVIREREVSEKKRIGC
ncbi:MAG: hypothetical protein QOJ54_3390 [Aliidongia sp.]|nr:hypothetical protein [Aliidongia sp.]